MVATGSDAAAEASQPENRSMSLGAARAPKRPVLELPSEDEFGDGDGDGGAPAPSAPPPAPQGDRFAAPADAPSADHDEDGEDDDVDGIVDPLAGLRSEMAAAQRAGASDEGAQRAEPAGRKEPLDLGAGAGADSGAGDRGAQSRQDELLLDADRLAEEDGPVQPRVGPGRRRGLVSGEEGGSGGGSTLFERMANLSRGSGDKGGGKPAPRDAEDDGDDDGGSLNIPRFLGRQNNQ